ncbi:MAG: hypothetical protein AVO35_08655 [Candidatus Aegiribacteria sp. MLS_C]|nr:MAG: hypothetical protein AVO35_08655 [Candidatus Aegiribacteria sp. MLS_C]
MPLRPGRKENMLVIKVITLLISARLLLQAAGDIRPSGSVEVFYGNGLPSLEALQLTSDLLEDFEGFFTVDFLPVDDPWSEHLLMRYGLSVDSLCFSVVVNGSHLALMDGDTVDFRDMPVRMHGTGGPEGDWTLMQLERVLRDNSLLIGGSPPDSGSRLLADRILEDAVSHLGAPYVWGGTGSTGFDCSGFAYRVFNDNGVPLPRALGDIETIGIPVERDDLRPCDILIFDSPRHSGIYMGDGQFIHCSSWQDRGVVITPLSSSNYSRRYSGAVRILGTGPDY